MSFVQVCKFESLSENSALSISRALWILFPWNILLYFREANTLLLLDIHCDAM